MKPSGKSPDVFAAIPNYNMGESLEELLPNVLGQDYAGVYVLDDGSTDGRHSLDVVQGFGGAVRWVEGGENIGAGGVRNRILGALARHDQRGIIHFIDADMRPETPNVPRLAREIMAEDHTLFAGGLVRMLDGRQHPFNYGPRMSLSTDARSPLQIAFYDRPRAHTYVANLLRDFPNPHGVAERRQVFWAGEANMLMDSELFARLGGFDPRLREHEIQDFAIRAHNAGLKGFFDPRFSATHLDVQVREGNRSLAQFKAELQIIGKHGLLQHVFPGGRFGQPTSEAV